MKLLRPITLLALGTSLLPLSPVWALLAQPWAFFKDPVWTIDGDQPGAYCYTDTTHLRIGFTGSLGIYRRVYLHLLDSDDRLFEPRLTWEGDLHSEGGKTYWRGGRFRQGWRNESTTASAYPLPQPALGELPSPQIIEIRVEEQGGGDRAPEMDPRIFTLHKIPAGLDRDQLLARLMELGCLRQARLLSGQSD